MDLASATVVAFASLVPSAPPCSLHSCCRAPSLSRNFHLNFISSLAPAPNALRAHFPDPSRRGKKVIAFCSSMPEEEFTVTRIHYHRMDGKYDEWECDAWGDLIVEKPGPITCAKGCDEYGVYWDVKVKIKGTFCFVVHKGEYKDCTGSALSSHVDVWVISGITDYFLQRPDLALLPWGSLSSARAYWIERSLIAWNVNVEDASFYLYASKMAKLSLSKEGIEGEDVKIKLEKDNGGLPSNVIERFPHIKDYKAFKITDDVDASSLIKCQLAIACFNAAAICMDATGLQLPGVLDDLFTYEGPLGAVFTEETVSLYLWAPTAQVVHACIYREPVGGDSLEIELKELNGVWSTHGPRSWEGSYYVYKVSVYHPNTSQTETCLVNDPYARGLSADGKRTLLVNLDCDTLRPDGWDELVDEKPELLSFSDITVYELHIRDFSASDLSLNPDICGGYLAFAEEDSAGVRHLKRLSSAGLTHVHLLPSFHFAGVEDEKEKWKCIDGYKLASLPPDSEGQQAEIVAIQDEDGYNWGYNPVLWGVPKGSYASKPNGPCRTLEFRKMVQALNRMGLRVVLDVVYNHLNGSGPLDDTSVLDKVVPGYYVRRNADGHIEHSTCINNTASEHFMVERLIIDDLLCWAINYKVDGFRFDLMGHIMKRTMDLRTQMMLGGGREEQGLYMFDAGLHHIHLQILLLSAVKAKNALTRLSKEENRIDGSKIYLYGEGWDFGEVADNGRGINASQFNVFGTGIGSFNDRIRDALLGGSPFGPPLQQGFVTGLSLQPNGHDHDGESDYDTDSALAALKDHIQPNGHDHDGESDSDTDSALAALKDHIQVGLAANLKDFVFTGHKGEAVKGSEVLTHDGSPVAYALCPTETVNYVSAHDNETLFDIISLKTPIELHIDERCRINHLATSIIALSQGIPFFHAGDELLRSKSLDRDSYNSGDWFNRLDFTYESNNWGVGLPPRGKNENNWPLIKARLADPRFKPEKSHILSAVQNFEDFLRIRYSSPLFRLETANSIQDIYSTMPRGRDIAWEHMTSVDGSTSRVRCNYCHHEMSRGATRMKEHLLGRRGEVVPCLRIPRAIQDHIRSEVGDKSKVKASAKARTSTQAHDDDAQARTSTQAHDDDAQACTSTQAHDYDRELEIVLQLSRQEAELQKRQAALEEEEMELAIQRSLQDPSRYGQGSSSKFSGGPIIRDPPSSSSRYQPYPYQTHSDSDSSST